MRADTELTGPRNNARARCHECTWQQETNGVGDEVRRLATNHTKATDHAVDVWYRYTISVKEKT